MVGRGDEGFSDDLATCGGLPTTTRVLKFWCTTSDGGDLVLEPNGFGSSNFGDLAGFFVGIGEDGSTGIAIVRL